MQEITQEQITNSAVLCLKGFIDSFDHTNDVHGFIICLMAMMASESMEEVISYIENSSMKIIDHELVLVILTKCDNIIGRFRKNYDKFTKEMMQ